MLSNLEVFLVGTKFPENVGMTARACANMGCPALTLVAPAWWDKDKARPLATGKGEAVLDRVRVVASLQEALAPMIFSVATTARVGGWRQEILSPEQAATELVLHMQEGPVALIFGSEDRGLTNVHIELCQRIACIPTQNGASSLNVSQAALLMLYECVKAAENLAKTRAETHSGTPAAGVTHLGPGPLSRLITHAEQTLVYDTLRETLLEIDYLKPDNPDYFLMPLRRFLNKTGLRRHEMDMLMGICRQVRQRLRQ